MTLGNKNNPLKEHSCGITKFLSPPISYAIGYLHSLPLGRVREGLPFHPCTPSATRRNSV